MRDLVVVFKKKLSTICVILVKNTKTLITVWMSHFDTFKIIPISSYSMPQCLRYYFAKMVAMSSLFLFTCP